MRHANLRPKPASITCDEQPPWPCSSYLTSHKVTIVDVEESNSVMIAMTLLVTFCRGPFTRLFGKLEGGVCYRASFVIVHTIMILSGVRVH